MRGLRHDEYAFALVLREQPYRRATDTEEDCLPAMVAAGWVREYVLNQPCPCGCGYGWGRAELTPAGLEAMRIYEAMQLAESAS